MSKPKAARKQQTPTPAPKPETESKSVSKVEAPVRKLRIVPFEEEEKGEEFIDGAPINKVTPDES